MNWWRNLLSVTQNDKLITIQSSADSNVSGILLILNKRFKNFVVAEIRTRDART